MDKNMETDMEIGNKMIDNEIVESHRALSQTSERFLYYIRENPHAADRSNYNTLHWYDDRLKLQPWPVFRNQKACRQFEKASLGICKLVKQLHRRLFSNDPQKISRYYDIPEDIIIIELMTIGYPADSKSEPKREPIENIVCFEKWTF